MEAIFAPSSTDQSFSPYKQIKNPSKRNTRSFISRPTENLASINNIIHGGGGEGGLLFAPPPSVSFSYRPPFSVLYPNQQNQIRQQAQPKPQPQPPLLPLPLSKPRHSSLPPTTRKTNRSKDQSLRPKKSKHPIIKRDDHETKRTDQSLIVASTAPLGPDPKYLPKDVSKVLSSSPPSSFSLMAGNGVNTVSIKDLESFSGLVFTLSPPPSSLPLPKFSVKQKLSCTAEAAGIDAGATDNLRRLLRLRLSKN